MRFDMLKRPSRLSKGIKKSKLKRKSISESKFPKSIKKKSSRRRVYEDIDDRVADIFAKTNKYEDFLETVEFDPRNPDANRVAIYRAIELQHDAKTADYCIDAYDRFRKKFDVYNNEEAFNCAIEGDVICIPEIKTYADFAKLYLASEFENKEGFYDAIYNGIRGQGEFIIDMYNLPDCIHIDYEAFGKKLEERFFDKTHYGEGKFILSPINGLLLYPTYSIFDNGVENIYYLKNIKSFN